MARPEREDRLAGRLEGGLQDVPLTEGQRRRIRLLESVETEVCERIGRVCVVSGVDVTDVGVLVVAAEAHAMVFGPPSATTLRSRITPMVHVGTRQELYDFLAAVLPAAPESPGDPYVDLLQAAPAGCARVVVIDQASITILSYGSFVLLRMEPGRMPQA